MFFSELSINHLRPIPMALAESSNSGDDRSRDPEPAKNVHGPDDFNAITSCLNG